MSDLRESGDIESDADLVSFLYRPLYYADPSQREGLLEEECEFIVSKNRNGRIGTAKLTFFNTKATFSEAYDMGGF
jgi:replicative DNA helicase